MPISIISIILKFVSHLIGNMISRERIEEFVFMEIFTKGFKSFRISTVTSQLKISKQSLYYYFPSKNILVDDSLKFGFSRFIEKVEKTARNIPCPLTSIVFIAVDHFRFFSTIGNKFVEEISQMENLLPFVESCRQKRVELGNNLLSLCVEKSLLKPNVTLDDIFSLVKDKIVAFTKLESYDNFPTKKVFDIVVSIFRDISTFKGNDILSELIINYG